VPVASPGYPVNLILAGKACLVVGGGAVAARKIEGLVEVGAVVRVVALSVGSQVRALGVAFEERAYRRGEVAGNWLVISATGDPELNALIAHEAEVAGVWLNAADDPPSCTFTLPAVARQGPVSVAVATGGYSPALAQFLKAHVVGELGPEWSTLAEMLSAARERIKSNGGSTETSDWRVVVNWDMLELIRSGQVDMAKERIEAWLSSSSD
jgi:precorrin-2 dehydrogenase/sirohydrochlorin ferrochelatase